MKGESISCGESSEQRYIYKQIKMYARGYQNKGVDIVQKF
jgi:hypothetical protein